MAKETLGENLVISVAFDKSSFPENHTCDGDDISPEIRVSRIHSPYLAIILDDQIGPSQMFNHWLAWNIEAREIIPENIPKTGVVTVPFSAVQGTNSFGNIGYQGPCPPAGEIHTYYFNVYGLDKKLDIPPGSDKAALMRAMEKHMVQYGGQAFATYRRKK